MSKMLLGFLSVVLVAASAAAQTEVPFGPIPSTISDEAKEALAKAKPYPKEFTKLYRNKTEWQEWRQKWDQAWREGSEELVRRYGVSVEVLHIAGIPVRLITPKDFDQANSNCAILEIHGGGFVIGSPDAAYGDGVPIAARTNCRVFAIGYRLAPEHPFPSALDDCHKVYQAIVGDYSVKKIAVTGASAGGNLALALTLKLRSEDSKLPIPTCLAVVSPWVELDKKGDSYHTMANKDPTLQSYEAIEYCVKAYVPNGDLLNPLVSPVYGNYSETFPPTLIQTGTRDLLLSNCVRLYRQMRAGGTDVVISPFEGMWHGFGGELPEARLAEDERVAFLRKMLNLRELSGRTDAR